MNGEKFLSRRHQLVLWGLVALIFVGVAGLTIFVIILVESFVNG